MHIPITRLKATIHVLGAMLLIGAAVAAIVTIGMHSGAFGRSTELTVSFERIDGLRSGDQVRLQGLRVGTVARIRPPAQAGEPLLVTLRVDPAIARILKADCQATIASQGMIGQPVVELSTGTPDAEALDPAKQLTGQTNDGIAQLTKRASEALARLEQVTDEASSGLRNLNRITGAIVSGEGSLGQLVMKDDAYRKLVDLSDQGQRTLVDLEENLESLKRSWFFSRMFDERGYYDRDATLYDPSADQIRQSLTAKDLFETGTSILTPLGRTRLDQAVGRIHGSLRPDSRIVVAAFRESGAVGEPLNLQLTQKQAEAVRDYLERAHRISYVNLFKSRKVTAVGFGSRPPSHWNETQPVAGRVDLVVLTPRADRS